MIFADFDLFEFFAQQIQKQVLFLLSGYLEFIRNSPDPDLMAGWFKGEYGVMLQISFYLMIPIVFAATVGSLMYGGMQQVLRTYLWALPIGIFGGVAVIAFINLCIAVDNEMTAQAVSSTSAQVQGFYDAMNKNTTSPAGDVVVIWWSFVQLVLMLFMFFLVFMLWVEMFFREVMIYMSTMFIPFALAAYIWGPIRVWVYNLFELVMTMVFAKFVIVAIAGFGFTVVGYAVTGNGSFYQLPAHAPNAVATVHKPGDPIPPATGTATAPSPNAGVAPPPGPGATPAGQNTATSATTAAAANPNLPPIDQKTSDIFGLLVGGLIVLVIACLSGPVLVTFVMNPSHQILSFKAAKTLTPWNHDRKFAGDLVQRNFKSLKSAAKMAAK